MLSNTYTFGIIDYIVFLVMLLASTGVGVYFGFFAKSKNTTDEYLMGDRKMKTIPIAISLVASQLTSISIMSIPAETYSFGFIYVFVAISMLAIAPLLMYIITPVFYENNISNCYEYLQKRFNVASRQLVTATFILNSLLILPILVFIPSLAFSQVSGLNTHLINIIASSICIFYTMMGGIKAVVWTDVLQAGIMLTSVILVGIVGTIRVGSLHRVLEYAKDGGRLEINTSLDPRTRITIWNSFLSGAMFWIGHIGFSQTCVQRIVSLPSLKNAQRSLLITAVGVISIMGFNCYIGIVMYAYYYNCDPISAGVYAVKKQEKFLNNTHAEKSQGMHRDAFMNVNTKSFYFEIELKGSFFNKIKGKQLSDGVKFVEKADKMMPFFVQDILGHMKGVPGIFISCVFSASLSTLSASFNSVTGIIYFDYIKPFIRHTDAKANFIMKLSVIIIGCYCIVGGFVVQEFNSILQMIITFTGINFGAVVGLFMLGMFVPRVNGKVALISFGLTLFSMTWLIVNAQIRQKNGILKYNPLSLRVDGCDTRNMSILKNNSFTTVVSPTFSPHTTVSLADRNFSIYDISFCWYKVSGLIVISVLGILLSFVFKRDEAEELDPKLYSYLIRKHPRKQSLQMEEIEPLKVRVSPK